MTDAWQRREQSPAVKTFDALFAELSDKVRTRPAFPNLVRKDLAARGIEVTVIRRDGAVEISVQLGVADAIAFVVAFGMSWGSVVWVLLGEMFLNRIRGAALGLAAAAQCIANCAITASFPKLGEFSLSLAYGFCALCAALSFAFVWRWVAETKGKHLEDMEGGAVHHGVGPVGH